MVFARFRCDFRKITAEEFLLLTSLNPQCSSLPQIIRGSESAVHEIEREKNLTPRWRVISRSFYGNKKKHGVKKKKCLYKSNVQIRRMRKLQTYSICDLLSITLSNFIHVFPSVHIGNVNEVRTVPRYDDAAWARAMQRTHWDWERLEQRHSPTAYAQNDAAYNSCAEHDIAIDQRGETHWYCRHNLISTRRAETIENIDMPAEFSQTDRNAPIRIECIFHI